MQWYPLLSLYSLSSAKSTLGGAKSTLGGALAITIMTVMVIYGMIGMIDRFTPTQLVEQLREAGWNLRAVIDLTYTSRYYDPKVLHDG